MTTTTTTEDIAAIALALRIGLGRNHVEPGWGDHRRRLDELSELVMAAALRMSADGRRTTTRHLVRCAQELDRAHRIGGDAFIAAARAEMNAAVDAYADGN